MDDAHSIPSTRARHHASAHPQSMRPPRAATATPTMEYDGTLHICQQEAVMTHSKDEAELAEMKRKAAQQVPEDAIEALRRAQDEWIRWHTAPKKPLGGIYTVNGQYDK